MFCGLSLVVIAANTDRSELVGFLEEQGYSQVEIGGYAYLACGEFYRNSFKAVNSNGKKVEGYVCEGLFKGKTIRFE